MENRDLPHLVETRISRRVRVLSTERLPQEVVVVHADAFDQERDLPSTGDQVTVVYGNRVLRGEVVSIVFLVAVPE